MEVGHPVIAHLFLGESGESGESSESKIKKKSQLALLPLAQKRTLYLKIMHFQSDGNGDQEFIFAVKLSCNMSTLLKEKGVLG